MSDLSTLADGLNLTESQLQQLQVNLQSLQSAKLLELDDDVARAIEGTKMTRAGFDLLARACAGGQLVYTRVVVGDAIKNGTVTTPTDEEILDMTELINYRGLVVPISDIRFTGNGTATIKCLIQNMSVTKGFWLREFGIYAKIQGDSEAVLYCYKNDGLLGKFIPPSGGAVSMNLVYNLITVVDQATNVTAIVNADLIYTSQADFLDHINSETPHPNIPTKAAELTTTGTLWAAGNDNQLHPISSDNLSAQILGDNSLKLPHLSSRVSQAEINIANLFMQVAAKEGTNLDANLLIAEDFSDCRFCDLFAVKVTSAVNADDNIIVADATGILEGHYYTLADGVRSQYLRVQYVAKNGNNYHIFFTERLKHSFTPKKTWLYRSTGLVMENKMGGAGDLRSTSYTFTDSWQGESSSSEQTLTLKTQLNNASKFELSGDAGFTADGEFTLS